MPARPCPGRDHLRGLAAEGDEAEPVAAPAREVPERERDALGDVGLPPLGRAEGHRGRDVEREPRDEHALGEVDPHVRLARARRHVPLDPAHVVAGHVRPDLGELAAGAEEGGAVVAGEHALDPAPDRQVERAQERLRQRAGARAVGRALERMRPRSSGHGRGGQAAASALLERSSSGAGTFASTASRILSASTSSASAW